LLSTRETVPMAYPDSFAISLMVIHRKLLPAAGCRSH
jgi:hypothetical protein